MSYVHQHLHCVTETDNLQNAYSRTELTRIRMVCSETSNFLLYSLKLLVTVYTTYLYSVYFIVKENDTHIQ